MRLRDADGDGTAEVKETFLDGLNQPFGMALVGDRFYVGNTDGVVAFAWDAGTASARGPGRTIATFKPGGHWTRSLLPSPDGTRLYVGIGSLSNIGDEGMAAEEAYLESLRSPTGEPVTFRYRNSCCAFPTRNAWFGTEALLDAFDVRYPGLRKPIVIYLNKYEWQEPRAPVGFTLDPARPE